MNNNTNLKVKSAVILHENGMSVIEISELLQVSRQRVYQLLKKEERRKNNEARKAAIRIKINKSISWPNGLTGRNSGGK